MRGGEPLTSACHHCPVLFMGAHHRLRAMVLAFVVGEVGHCVTWHCDIHRRRCCVQWWLGGSNGC